VKVDSHLKKYFENISKTEEIANMNWKSLNLKKNIKQATAFTTTGNPTASVKF